MDEALAARERKAARWRLLDQARKITTLKRLGECRRATLTGSGNPVLRTAPGGGKAGYAGLSTCGSPWACPCCSGKIAGERASELAAVMGAVHDLGGVIDFVTFTIRHHRGHRLTDVWDAVSAAWAAATKEDRWTPEERQLMLGWVRVVEPVWTYNAGWHVHVHALVAWREPVSEDWSAQVGLRCWRRWDAAARRKGFDSTPTRGVKVERCGDGDTALAGYFGKLALELTSSWTKDARDGRTPFAILQDAVETYRVDDIELWREFEQGSQRRKQISWSQGRMDLRKLAGLGRERTDEEIAEADEGGANALALVGETWGEMSRRGEQPDLLSTTDERGLTGAVEWLDARGYDWAWCRPAACERDRRRERPPRLRDEARAVLKS